MKLKKLANLKNVRIEMPIDFELGGVAFKFTALVKLVTQADIDDINKNKTSDPEIVSQLLVGWTGFTDEGEDVPYSQGVKAEMLAFPGIANRLATACLQAQYAVQEKN
ncbi:hypothetical protein [Pseudoalteromonas rubra]|uniref:Phage tail protein n=1 Tax=Pseudoalteromonas rubra TaxID=43658 RepID=A0A0U3GRV2_9GAMM|nr:hypothetical protein [Pseudoalteromonas rubra]ALU41939.1 hypothetical protein AT705_02735 [Pseudoalteromonas rubra]